MTEREPLPVPPGYDEEERLFVARYGAWEPMDPEAARDFFAGFERPWWILGGWAIEAFTGLPREHEDLDVSVLERDVEALRQHVGDRWHLWSNAGGTFRLMTDERPELQESGCQIWVRRDAQSPWVLDLPTTPDHDGLWTHKKLENDVRRVEDATWVATDGLRYLHPEIVLSYKARLARPKDERDLLVAWPMLDAPQQEWLLDAVRRQDEEHRWLPFLEGTATDPSTSE